MEIHLRTLVFVVMSLLGSLSLPFVAGFLPAAEPSTLLAALPTATPVPLRGLSPAARTLAATLDAPTPLPTTTAAVTQCSARSKPDRHRPQRRWPVAARRSARRRRQRLGLSGVGEFTQYRWVDGGRWRIKPLVTSREKPLASSHWSLNVIKLRIHRCGF